ncbi:MAG TPA: NAD(P)H-dependent oxidoreductase [Clostridiales bacterium]|nr:NAD(P)H-dependent oxidoreductase [Clostridiales bacterium]
MHILVVDACIRDEHSRTKRLLNAAVEAAKEEAEKKGISLQQETVSVMEEEAALLPLNLKRLQERDKLILEKQFDHPLFRFARQFAAADGILVAAPFWDMSYPALLKLYLERVSVDGITFTATDTGLLGLCHAKKMLYLSTRGGFPDGNREDAGAQNLHDLCSMYGIPEFEAVCAYGTDLPDASAVENSLRDAEQAARESAVSLLK